MTSKQLREASEWAKHQEKQLKFEFPDKRLGEEPATEKQIQYIRVLVNSIDEAKLKTLGKWQASALIEYILTEKEIYTHQLAETYIENNQPSDTSQLVTPTLVTPRLVTPTPRRSNITILVVLTIALLLTVGYALLYL